MTYAIGNIVYGVDLQVPYRADDPFAHVRDDIEDQPDFITTQYSGNGDAPTYFGLDIDDIDETRTIIGDELIHTLTVTDGHRAQYATKLAELDDAEEDWAELVAVLRNSVPRMFITWGSS